MDTDAARKSTVQTRIDQTLINFFETSIERAEQIDTHYADLWKYMYRLHQSGGKRVRPKIVMMAYRAFGGTDDENVIPLACAQELLHFSMLIHDDIIDRDTTRYGVDNISGMYQKSYSTLVSDETDKMHYADSAAVMAGDLMIASAHKLISESQLDDSKKISALNTMYNSIFDVVGGELLDTESSFRPAGSIDPIKVAYFKTASYSFVGPLLTGAIAANSTSEQQATLRDLGINLGIAYQLTDDLLGVFGDTEKTGKSNTGDIREGKQTHLINCTVKRLPVNELVLFNSKFGKHTISDADIALVKDLIVSSGAKLETEQLIDQYVDKAISALKQLSLPSASYNEFAELISYATKRDF